MEEQLYDLMQDFQESASKLKQTLDSIWSLCQDEEFSLWEKEGCSVNLVKDVLGPEERNLAGNLAVELIQFLY